MYVYAKFSDIKENKFDPSEQDFYDSYTVLMMMIQYFSSNDEIDTESYLTAFTCSAELTFVGQC